MTRQKELVKNTFILFLGKVSTQFLSFFLLPIYTRFLEKSDYGLVDLILTYVSLLVPVITIQQEMATFRFLIDSRDDENKIKRVISTSIRNVFPYLILFLILAFIIMQFIQIKYIYFILINISICIFSNLFLQIARGLGKTIHFSIASFITGIITLCSNIILICYYKTGAKGMLISMSLANSICTLYLFFSLKLYKYIKLKSYDRKLSIEMMKYSLPLVPNGISWWFINVSDRTIVTLVLGSAANGIYAIANKFPSIISSLLGIFTLSWTESAALHINDKDKDKFFTNVAETVLRLFSCACLGLISFLPLAFNILIGNKYIDSYNYIPIFIIGSMASCIVSVYSAIYIAKKLTKKVASTSIASAIINIVINLIFIKFIGLYAAAISTALAYLIMMLYRHYDVKKYVEIKYDLRLIISTIILFTIVIYLYYINNNYLNIVSFVGIIIYSVFINKSIIKNLIYKLHKKVK